MTSAPLPLPPPCVPAPTGTMVQMDPADEDHSGDLLSPEPNLASSLLSIDDEPSQSKVSGEKKRRTTLESCHGANTLLLVPGY